MPEEPLAGGRSRAGVVRSGTTVRRPQTAGSPFVHRVLLRLEAAGVGGVPRFLGIDSEDREILSYLPGDTGHDIHPWTDDQLTDLARLVRSVHNALAGTPEAGPAETVCHNDLAPWNTILRSGRPVAFIDFDDAAPGTRTDDLAYLLWTFLNLGTPAPARTGEPAQPVAAETQARRIRRFCDVYATPTTAGRDPSPAGSDHAAPIADRDRDGADGEPDQLDSHIRSDLLAALDRQQHRILAFRAAQPDPFSAEKHTEILASIAWTHVHHTTLAAHLAD